MTNTVKVHIPSELRIQVDNQNFVELAGESVHEILAQLSSSYPALGKRLFNTEGRLNRYVNVYLNDEDIRFLQNLEPTVHSGDEISIVPAIAGGCS